MRLKGMLLGLMAGLAIACDTGGDGADASTAGTENADTEPGATGTDEPDTDSLGTVTTGDTDTNGDSDDTDTDTDMDTDTDTDTDGPDPFDPACAASDPEVDAAFDVTLDGWEIDNGYGFYDIDDDCLISSVDVADGVWATELDCSDAETSRTATVSVAAVAEEDPDWAPGDEVRLQAIHNRNEFGGFDWFDLARGSDLLAQGIDGDDVDAGLETLTSRIEAVGSYDACGAPLPGDIDADVGKLALQFEYAEQSMTLVSGHRGALELPDGASLGIDVEQAESGHCCHGFHSLRVLKRRAADQG
ncbi:MAG: hypothetical protein ACRBN8_01790 [Nannocystales bacterium]